MRNKLKTMLKTYFGFSRAETNGFAIMVIIFIIVVFFSIFVDVLGVGNTKLDEASTKKLDSLVSLMEGKIAYVPLEGVNESNLIPEGLILNPNNANFKQLRQLGLSDIIANRILKYRKSGGKFYDIKDLKKIYGIDDELFIQIRPHLLLPTRQKPKIAGAKQKAFTPSVKHELISPFDINKVDSVKLKRIQGIGNILSKRIIKFRESLGGFSNLNQLYEVYGLEEAVVMKIKEKAFIGNEFDLVEININTAPKSALSKHPYISFKLADAIVKYRVQHGAFQSLDQLLNIHILSEQEFLKIKPYVSF